MRSAQGISINMLVIVAIVVLVMIVVGAFFISGFGQAGSGLQGVEATEAECNSICNSLKVDAFGYDLCTGTGSISETTQAQEFFDKECDVITGACLVSLRGGASCEITE